MNRQDHPVFHTDVTKVLSADSYLDSLFSPELTSHPPIDPSAAEDFVDLVDIVTNAAKLQYRPAGGQSGSLSKACEFISNVTEGVRTAPKPKPVRDVQGVTDDAEMALPYFAPLTQDEVWMRRLAEWVRFQVSTSYLQGIFWGANEVEELRRTLEAYRRHCRTDSDPIGRAVQILGSQPFGHAVKWLEALGWSASDFLIAYGFWAFIKGCRFSRALGEGDIYVVHWLRERAVVDFSGAVKGPQEKFGVRIPWGTILRHQLGSVAPDVPRARLVDVLRKLRRHSNQELRNTANRRQRLDFLAAGLVLFNDWMGIERGRGLDTLANMMGEYAADTHPGPGHGAKFVLQVLTRPIDKARAKRSIKTLAKSESRVEDFLQFGAVG